MSASTSGTTIGVSAQNDLILNNADATAMGFNTSNSRRMTITSAGNVGIGTNAPSTLLDVSGTGNFTGALTLGGGIIANSTTYTGAQLKTALDAANAALPKTGGTLTGLLTLDTTGISTGGTTYTAANVKSALDAANAALPKAGVRYRIIYMYQVVTRVYG